MSNRNIQIDICAVTVIVGSALLLPNAWKDFGMLVGIALALIYPVWAHWHLERARLINALIAVGGIAVGVYVLWPLNSPFW